MGLADGARYQTGFDIVSCCCAGVSAYRLRRYVQTKFNLGESEDASMCAVGLCGCCTVVQDVAELESRGEIGIFKSSPAKTVQPTAQAEMAAVPKEDDKAAAEQPAAM